MRIVGEGVVAPLRRTSILYDRLVAKTDGLNLLSDYDQ